MNTLLLFFALPIATIILAVVLEKILRIPILTASTFFAIYLIVTFAAFDSNFLIYVIIYTVLAFISALLAEFLFRRYCNIQRRCNTIELSDTDIENIANQLARIQNQNNNCSCNRTNDVATVNVTNNTTGGRTTWCCYRK